MKFEYEYEYLKCQSCTAKIHCEGCAEDVLELFQGKDAYGNMCMDMKAKTLSVEMEPEDEDDFLDALEAAGIFV